MIEKLGFIFLPLFAMCLIAVPVVMFWLESRDAKRANAEAKKAEIADKVANRRQSRPARRN